jgi:hypothetical protein
MILPLKISFTCTISLYPSILKKNNHFTPKLFCRLVPITGCGTTTWVVAFLPHVFFLRVVDPLNFSWPSMPLDRTNIACRDIDSLLLCPHHQGAGVAAPGLAVVASSFRRRWPARHGGSRDPMPCTSPNKCGCPRVILLRKWWPSWGQSFLPDQSDKFWKASPANVTVHLMPGVCWIGWYSVVRTHTFISAVWFWRERREALLVLPSDEILIHGEIRGREYHKVWIW